MQYFPGNNTSRFTVKLPEILHLNGQWEVALCEIGLPKAKPQPKKLIVCSEICNESIIGENRLPLLRVVTGRIPASFRTLQCIPVRPQDIERITRPVNQITEDGSIDIHVKASGSQYLDLQRSRLYVKAKIVKEDGGNLVTADVVTPVNLWLQSLWNQVDVFLQQKLVSSSGTNYAYKALMDVLLNYGVDAELSQLQTRLFYRDSGGSMDHTNPTTTPINQGLIKRNLLAKNSATIDMVGPIYADVFQMPRYLLNEVDVHVKLFQNKNSFRLMSSVANKKYKVVISEVILKAAMIGIHPDILKSHARALEDKPALYPLLKTEVKTFAVGKGQYNVNLDDIYQGKIPNRLILGMVSAEAYAGDLTKNPFNFKHYNFDFMCL